jgi:outer membrane protein W
MNKAILSLSLATAFAVVSSAAITNPAQAQSMKNKKKNYIGPAVTLGSNASAFGVNSRFGLSDNFSIRPFIEFATVQGISLTQFGAAATYDFNISQSDFQPYAGLGYISASVTDGVNSASGSGIYGIVGADYSLSNSLGLNANYRFDRSGGLFNIGAGLKF